MNSRPQINYSTFKGYLILDMNVHQQYEVLIQIYEIGNLSENRLYAPKKAFMACVLQCYTLKIPQCLRETNVQTKHKGKGLSF